MHIEHNTTSKSNSNPSVVQSSTECRQGNTRWSSPSDIAHCAAVDSALVQCGIVAAAELLTLGPPW